MRTNNQVVGNVGLFYVCYQLSRRGWNVMPTARNARGIDILVYSLIPVRTHVIVGQRVKDFGDGTAPQAQAGDQALSGGKGDTLQLESKLEPASRLATLTNRLLNTRT